MKEAISKAPLVRREEAFRLCKFKLSDQVESVFASFKILFDYAVSKADA